MLDEIIKINYFKKIYYGPLHQPKWHTLAIGFNVHITQSHVSYTVFYYLLNILNTKNQKLLPPVLKNFDLS